MTKDYSAETGAALADEDQPIKAFAHAVVTPAARTPSPGTFATIALDRITASLTNPRKTFDQTKLAELAAAFNVTDAGNSTTSEQARLAAPATAPEQCWCDEQGLGEPGILYGDCPTRDYKAPATTPEPVAWMSPKRFYRTRAMALTNGEQLIEPLYLRPPATAPEFPANWARMIHYPECWDTAAYPELHDAIHEALAWSGCSVCKPATAPAWYDAPTVPGLWLCTDGMSYTFNAATVRDYKPLFECRWYGPIPEDKP